MSFITVDENSRIGKLLAELMGKFENVPTEDLPESIQVAVGEARKQIGELESEKAETLSPLTDNLEAVQRNIQTALELSEIQDAVRTYENLDFLIQNGGSPDSLSEDVHGRVSSIVALVGDHMDQVSLRRNQISEAGEQYDTAIRALKTQVNMFIAGAIAKSYVQDIGPYLGKVNGLKDIVIDILADNRESIGGLLGVFHELALEVKEGTQDARMKLVDLKSREQRIELTALEEAFGSELAEVIFLSKMNAIQVTDPASLPGAMAPRS